ncbi:MAG: NAD(P)-dependent oxidoreductase [Acidimicrobiales bacterium]
MKILFADSVDESRLEPLQQLGHDCVVDGSLDADTLPEAVAGVEILVVRSTKVTAATIDAAHNLALVVRAGAGTDNIDKVAASQAGVYVCNVPGRNAIAVAELTMGLLLAIDRRIPDNTADLRRGTWNKKLYSEADGLHGKSLGIVGLGDIGLAVAERAKSFWNDRQRRPQGRPILRRTVSHPQCWGSPRRRPRSTPGGQRYCVLHVPKSPDTAAWSTPSSSPR